MRRRPSVQPDRPADPRIDRTREASLRAARSILVEEGWDAVSQLRVAERSGVGRTTVYRHWPDRADLIREAIELELVVTRDLDMTGELRSDLVRALEAIRYELIERAGSRILTAITVRAQVDEGFVETKRALVDQALSVLRDVLRDAVRRGALSGVDVDRAVSQLVGPMLMEHLVLESPVESEDVPALVDGFLSAHGG